MPRPLIALDWGTTRARAFLLDESGAVIGRRSADQGIQSVPAGGFPAAFEAIAGEFRRARPEADIVLAGMVGSRNGWIEAPYVACPAAAEAIASAALTVTLDDGTPALIVPGLSHLDTAFDVMRGEETLLLGLDREDGLACLPGTHSKWARIEGGRITRFASFMTGEVYGLLREHSILARLATAAAAGEEAEGRRRGLAAAAWPGGLLNAVFAARSEVLGGRMGGGSVGAFLSALLVGEELRGARALFGDAPVIDLVADSVLAESYGAAFAAAGVPFRPTTPEAAFLAGIRRIALLRRDQSIF